MASWIIPGTIGTCPRRSFPRSFQTRCQVSRRRLRFRRRARSCLDSAAGDEWLRTDRIRLSHLNESAKRVDHLNLFRRGAGPGAHRARGADRGEDVHGGVSEERRLTRYKTPPARPAADLTNSLRETRPASGGGTEWWMPIPLGHSRPRPALAHSHSISLTRPAVICERDLCGRSQDRSSYPTTG
jgi:hypothetical protein